MSAHTLLGIAQRLASHSQSERTAAYAQLALVGALLLYSLLTAKRPPSGLDLSRAFLLAMFLDDICILSGNTMEDSVRCFRLCIGNAGVDFVANKRNTRFAWYHRACVK